MDKTLNWRRSGNRLTDTPTNTHTDIQDRLQYTAPLSLACSVIRLAQSPSHKFNSLNLLRRQSCSVTERDLAAALYTQRQKIIEEYLVTLTVLRAQVSIQPTRPKLKFSIQPDPTEPTPWIDPTIPQPRRFPYLTLMWSETVGLRTRPV